MIVEVGQIHELFRYPVKSMAGVAVASALLDGMVLKVTDVLPSAER